ncbi:MAG: beta-hydroxyacyl-ACP dehydratase [Deltaproteobacteria bacterium]|nr:beta-hydroxyacyl-ACP dehydratase [Deltaproteobacteria bacterium]
MRFILLDRIVKMERGQGGSFVKNVTQSEDFFADHFPECPIMPGVLILESFDQATQFLLGDQHDFGCYPELRQVLRVTFRHRVVPGDQLHINLRVARKSAEEAIVKADAEVDGRTVAEATLVFSLVQGDRNAEAKAHCQRLRGLYDYLSVDTVDRAWESLADRF